MSKYAAIKEIPVQEVLDHYGVKLMPKTITGDEKLVGVCPIHEHKDEPNRNSNAFQFTLKSPKYPKTESTFMCFGCKARGTVLDFVILMEKLVDANKIDWPLVKIKRQTGENWASTEALKEASRRMEAWFLEKNPKRIETAYIPPETPIKPITKNIPWRERWPDKPNPTYHKFYQPNDYLASRGIRQEILDAFGIGYYFNAGQKNNVRNGTIFIPIHDINGELVAFANRAVGDAEPKYRFPNAEQFNKTLEIFNVHRAMEEKHTYLTEGFFGTLNLVQYGYNSCALMGSLISDTQASLLADHFLAVTLIVDPDHAGAGLAEQVIRKLHGRMVLKMVFPLGQVDEMAEEELEGLLR